MHRILYPDNHCKKRGTHALASPKHIQIGQHIQDIVADLLYSRWGCILGRPGGDGTRSKQLCHEPPDRIFQLLLIRSREMELNIAFPGKNFRVVNHIFIQCRNNNRAFLLAQPFQQLSCPLLLIGVHAKL